MIKEYIIKYEHLNSILTKIDNFITITNKFNEKHKHYKYKVSITKNKDLWDAKLKINNETKHNT
jgi:hypothetical protein